MNDLQKQIEDELKILKQQLGIFENHSMPRPTLKNQIKLDAKIHCCKGRIKFLESLNVPDNVKKSDTTLCSVCYKRKKMDLRLAKDYVKKEDVKKWFKDNDIDNTEIVAMDHTDFDNFIMWLNNLEG